MARGAGGSGVAAQQQRVQSDQIEPFNKRPSPEILLLYNSYSSLSSPHKKNSLTLAVVAAAAADDTTSYEMTTTSSWYLPRPRRHRVENANKSHKNGEEWKEKKKKENNKRAEQMTSEMITREKEWHAVGRGKRAHTKRERETGGWWGSRAKIKISQTSLLLTFLFDSSH